MRRSRPLLLLAPFALAVACGGAIEDLVEVPAQDGADGSISDGAARVDGPPRPEASSPETGPTDASVDAADAADAADARDASPSCGADASTLCADGAACQVDADCKSAVCSSITNACVAVPPPTTATITQLVAGRNHTCALWTDGVLKCWGDNTYGQLGLGDTISRGKAPGEMGAALPVVATGVSAVVTGGDHTCVKYGAGGVDCFGNNTSGQLGIDSALPVRAPGAGGRLPKISGLKQNCDLVGVSLGGDFTDSPLPAGAGLKCWGDNALGQLGAGDTTNRGDSAGEMAGLPTMPFPVKPAYPPAPSNQYHGWTPKPYWVVATERASSASHACVAWREAYWTHPTTDDGTSAAKVACWGKNDKGQLGLGDTNHRGDAPGEPAPPENQVKVTSLPQGVGYFLIAAGGSHTCVVIRQRFNQQAPKAFVKCWGDNSRGQLGLGDTSNRGDDPGEMGDALPTVAGAITQYQPDGPRLSPYPVLGESHSCVVAQTGSPGVGALPAIVRCWGANEAGQLGLGDASDRGTLPNQLPTPLVDLGGGKQVAPSPATGQVLIASGANHVCVALADPPLPGWPPRWPATTIKCWGKNDRGQLGLGDTNNRGDQPGEMGDALPLVRAR